MEVEISSWGIFINEDILDQETNFSWKVLGIDDAGNVIYVLSESLVVSWVSAGGGGSGYWTGNGSHIYNTNAGNVGIWTSTMNGKLHVKGSGETDIYIEETNTGNAANLNLKNIVRTRALGWDSSPDVFYVGIAGGSRYLVIKPTGEVGIGTDNPDANLQVIGNFIGGETGNTILGVNSSIWWWGNWPYPNNIIWDYWFIWWWTYQNISWWYGTIAGWATNTIVWNKSSIGWWSSNTITGLRNTIAGGDQNKIDSVSSIIGWWYDNIINSVSWLRNFIGWGGSNTISWTANYNIIGWGQNNEITSSSNAFIGGGWSNKINSSARSVIVGWYGNTIDSTSHHSVIPGGEQNYIEWSLHSFAAGIHTKIINHPNTFARNSDISTGFYAERKGSFLINVPFSNDGSAQGGVGINVNNPATALDVDWLIRTRAITTTVACDSTIAWAIQFSWTNFYGCDGNTRKQLDN